MEAKEVFWLFPTDAARQVGTVPEQAVWEPAALLPTAPREQQPPRDGKVPARAGGQGGRIHPGWLCTGLICQEYKNNVAEAMSGLGERPEGRKQCCAAPAVGWVIQLEVSQKGKKMSYLQFKKKKNQKKSKWRYIVGEANL